MTRKWKRWLCLGIALGLLLHNLSWAPWRVIRADSLWREASPLFGGTARLSSPKSEGGECDQVLVRLEEWVTPNQARALLAQHGQVVRQIPRLDVWLIASCQKPAAVLARELEGVSFDGAHDVPFDGILWAEPNGRYHALGITPNDNFYRAQQDNLRLMGLPEAWVFTTGDASPIAILDTGVDLDHPDLAAKVWVNPSELPGNGLDDDGNGYVDDVQGWDFVHGNGVPDDDENPGHGSQVAGIAAAHTDNGTGIAGVAWETPVMSLKVLNQAGEGTWADVAEAIVYAADNGARVLNLSFGGSEPESEPSQTVQAAIAYARGRGCLLVAAAGNYDGQTRAVLYPAAYPGVLAIAATTESDASWSNSNYGPEIDVAAPGVSIFTTSRNSRYAEAYGTSMSAPHVSGLAALIWSFQPTLTAEQVTHVITDTARDIYTPGWDSRTGWGRVDAQAAILHLAGPQVDLVADRSVVSAKLDGGTLLLAGESATLTATVTYNQGRPVPDGLAVTFLTDLGSVMPQTANTQEGGQVTATFTSTHSGWATITARVGSGFQETLTLFVASHHVYMPLLYDPVLIYWED